MRPFVSTLGGYVVAACEETGEILVLLTDTIRECRWALVNRPRLDMQMKRIGNDTLFIAAVIAVFIGMVLALHTGYAHIQLPTQSFTRRSLNRAR